jgi:ribosome-binding protein aMBF1 (putative translation factor)
MPTSDLWRDLSAQFFNGKKSADMGTFESLARRGASWFRPRPRGDLFAAWMKAIRKRNKGIPLDPFAPALWDLSVDLCNVMEREALERERLFQKLEASSAAEPDLSERVRALEERLQRTTEADPMHASTDQGRSETPGEQIERLRQQCDLTLEALAEKVGIDPTNVSRHIRNLSKPTVRNRRRYERVFSSLLKAQILITKTQVKRS